MLEGYQEGIYKEYSTIYQKKTKHRKKCLVCGKLVADGNPVTMRAIRKVKRYPIKGHMVFVTWYAIHEECY